MVDLHAPPPVWERVSELIAPPCTPTLPYSHQHHQLCIIITCIVSPKPRESLGGAAQERTPRRGVSPCVVLVTTFAWSGGGA